MSYAENAILTKSRAIYADRLTLENYNEMLQSKSIAELVSYLASKTHYHNAFANATSVKMNRLMLESTVKRSLTDRLMSLCEFSKILGNGMYRYIVIKNDIREILSAVRFMEAPNKYEGLISMPVFLDRITTVNMRELAAANSFEEIVEKLEKTEYHKVLGRFAANSTEMLLIENALNKYLFEKSMEIAKKELKSGERKAVEDFLKMTADVKLISNMYRMKTYFNFTAGDIENCGLETGVTALGKNQLRELKNAETKEDFFKSLKNTPYGKKFTTEDFSDIETSLTKYVFEKASHNALYSTYPNEVMLCCVFLGENEIKNITHIAEGIKFNVSPEIIKSKLISREIMKEGEKAWQ